ncbi:MAG: aminotransferase class IV [Tatlockia sp.]|jgi:4-amino-4-deoxychorismate lyase
MKKTTVSLQENNKGVLLSLDDRVFLGEGLFETIKIAQGKAQYSQLHWERLRQGALVLDIPFDLSLASWQASIQHLIDTTSLQQGGMKAILCSKEAPRGLHVHSTHSTLFLHGFHYQVDSTPLHLMSAPWVRDAKNPIYRLKSLNYLEAIMARRYALEHAADEVLFFNSEHHLMETPIASLFLVKNESLYTPCQDSGILAGVIRQRLLDLSKKNNIPCIETYLTKEDLLAAEAVFTCNALQGIRAVKSFETTSFNCAHPLVAQLMHYLALESA